MTTNFPFGLSALTDRGECLLRIFQVMIYVAEKDQVNTFTGQIGR